MTKAVVMQVTDIKNRRQDMNTRQFLFTAADSIRHLIRAVRTLPKTWLVVFLATCLAAHALPAVAAPEHAAPIQVITDHTTPEQQSGTPPAQWQVASNTGSGPVTAAGAVTTSAVEPVSPQQAPPLPTAPQAATDESPTKHGMDDQGRADWRELEKGLLFGEFQLNDGDARLSVLRIDPAYFDFTLCARSQDSGPSRPLSQWGEQYNLSAAINASMYLPDGSTSTGYMRQGDHTNNGRIVQRFGAFFVAGPDEPGLPLAAIIDRDNPLWRQQMERYSLVIQNYRMINADRRILWAPGGPHYSISAVAQDGDGQILFMHCRQPVEAYAFAQQVLHLPLNVRTVMYVEGGGQAGLLVRSAALTRELVGLSPSGLLVTGDLRAVLPNVLGARRKGAPEHPAENSTTAPAQPAATPATTTPAGEGKSPATPVAPAAESGAPASAPQQKTAQQSDTTVAIPPLAPSHTVAPMPGQKQLQGQMQDQAQQQSPSNRAASTAQKPATSATAPANEPLTQPGTTTGQPPAGTSESISPNSDTAPKK